MSTSNTTITEALTKAEQTAALVVSDVREAHQAACHAEPILTLLLLDVLEQAANLQVRLQQINAIRSEGAN